MTVYERNMAFARLDMFLTRGGLRMVESNTETPGGNEECTALENGYLRFIGLAGVEQRSRLEAVFGTLMDHYAVQMRHKGITPAEKPYVNLITWNWDIDRIRGEYNVLIDFIRAQGCDCDIIDPNELVFAGGAGQNPKTGKKVDLFYRRFTTDELPKQSKNGFELARLLNDSGAAVVNPFCTKRVDSKNIMVLIDDPAYRGVFPPELLPHVERIGEVLPWTRKVAGEMLVDGKPVDGRRYLTERRQKLVVKEANSYSSVGVFIGEDHSEAEWAAVLDRALEGDHIVQEKIDLPTIAVTLYDGKAESTHELIYNVNPYLFNDGYGGIYIRASSDKLTSFKVGGVATVLPAFLGEAAAVAR
jgi:glutathionylspermidine synthase